MSRVVVVGAGFGGLACCQALSEFADQGLANVRLLDRGETMSISASWQYALMGRCELQATDRRLSKAVMSDKIVRSFSTSVVKVDTASKFVVARGKDGREEQIPYDYLVLCCGVESHPELLPGAESHMLDVCKQSTATELARRIEGFKGGERVVLLTAALPYKCPPVVFEYAFLVDELLSKRGIREHCSITITTPSPDFPFGGPNIAAAFMGAAKSKNIEFRIGLTPTSLSAASMQVRNQDGSTAQLPCDLAIGTLPQRAPHVFRELCNEKGFIPADLYTCETAFPGVFALGDCSWLVLPTTPPKPHPKAGEFAIAQAEQASQIIRALIAGKSVEEARAETPRGRDRSCYIESGGDTGMLVNFILPETGPPQFKTGSPDKMWFDKKQQWLNALYVRFFDQALEMNSE